MRSEYTRKRDKWLNIYDYGKNVVLPYLLDKKISSLDYIMISHFDLDHARGSNRNIRKYEG